MESFCKISVPPPLDPGVQTWEGASGPQLSFRRLPRSQTPSLPPHSWTSGLLSPPKHLRAVAVPSWRVRGLEGRPSPSGSVNVERRESKLSC